MPTAPHIYWVLFSLYWAQGLPVGFMTHALPTILRAEGVSLAHIGGFGLLMLPWSLKIIWAPWVDRFGSFKKGHYRSWIIPTQLLTIVSLVCLSFIPIDTLNQPVYLLGFFIVLMSMNLFGATQDIATDGLAVNILKGSQQYWGNMIQVIGSRLGFIVGGGAILWALDHLNWQITFLLLAILVALNTLPILFYQEPQHDQETVLLIQKKNSIKIREYLNYFIQSDILRMWLGVLMTFKIVDGLMGPLIKPLLVDIGLSFTEIGLYISMLGAGAALLGAGLAGLVLKYYSKTSALLIFSILKIFSLTAYVWLAYLYALNHAIPYWIIYLINAIEDMISSMLLVVMLTLILQYSRKKFAGTDFTFQVALMATISGMLYVFSGVVGDILGYWKYLILINIIAILCLIPIIRWIKLVKINT